MPEVSAQNVHDVLAKWVLADGLSLVCDLAKSQGPYLYDARSGKELLDFFSFVASRPLAYNHPKLIDPAFKKRLADVALHKPSNCDVYTVEYAEFVDKFGTVALGGQFKHIF